MEMYTGLFVIGIRGTEMSLDLLNKGFIPYLNPNEGLPGYQKWLKEVCEAQDAIKTQCLSIADRHAPLSVTVLEIVGFTPEWNDGEECSHRTSYYINGLNDYGETLIYDEENELPYTRWDSEKRKLINLITPYEPFLEKAFGTNWLIGLVRTTDGFQFAINSRPPPY